MYDNAGHAPIHKLISSNIGAVCPFLTIHFSLASLCGISASNIELVPQSVISQS